VRTTAQAGTASTQQAQARSELQHQHKVTHHKHDAQADPAKPHKLKPAQPPTTAETVVNNCNRTTPAPKLKQSQPPTTVATVVNNCD
jgi:uncharacterized protein YciW